MPNQFLVFGGIILFQLLIYFKYFRKKNALLRLPPGPRPLPIIGNIFDLPPPGVPEFQHWLKFKDTYGPISSVTVWGQTMIIIHDKQAAYDLLEKMSINTSNRPVSTFGDELVGLKKLMSNKQYNETFRLHRKLIHQQVGTKTYTARFFGTLDVESRRFLYRTLEDPKNFMQHLKTYQSNSQAAAVVLKIAYGYSVDPNMADPLVDLIEDMLTVLSNSLVPLSWLVDMVPALKYLPDWFPGTAFKKTARQWNKLNQTTADIPFAFVRREMANGTHRPSYVSALIEKCGRGDVQDEELDAIKWTAMIIYGGATDTTAFTLSAFALAMTMFPEVQQKAQEEIDSVIGTTPDRLPEFEDRERLPYISAVVKETIRWFPLVAMNTAHATNREITYNGYRIPKGAYLLAATWWFLRDPQTYPDPSAFIPERFLEPRNEPDPTGAFGWGRRICPGQYLAYDSVFISIARIVATFNVTKAVDEQGRPIEPKPEHAPGLLSHPVDVPSKFTVRSDRHAELIRSVVVDHPWERSDADRLDFEGVQTGAV